MADDTQNQAPLSLDSPEVNDFLSDQDPQSTMAAKGLATLGSMAGQNLDEYQRNLNNAIAGDPDAQTYIASRSLGTAMASVKTPKALPMDQASRMARAEKMGFDTSKTYYHGTRADIESFDPNTLGTSTNAPSAKKGFFFAEDPSTASDYANLSSGRATLRAKALDESAWQPVEEAGNQLDAKYGPKWRTPEDYQDLISRYTEADVPNPEAELEKLGIKPADSKDPLLSQYLTARAEAEKATEALDIEPVLELSKLEHNKAAIGSPPKFTKSDLDGHKKNLAYWQDYLNNYDTNPSGYKKPKEDVQGIIDTLTDKIQNFKSYGKKAQADYSAKIDPINERIAKMKALIESEKAGQNVTPVHLKMENPYIHDFKGQGYRDESYNNIIKKAKDAGHDSVILKNTFDPADPENSVKQDIHVVFEPNQIRSKFGTFDPKKAKSGNISYAQGGEVSKSGNQNISLDSPEVDSFLSDGGNHQLGSVDGGLSLDSPEVNEFLAPELKQAKYGTGLEQFKAGIEGAAQGLVGPFAPGAEQALGVEPEDIRGRAEANPLTHVAGEALGLIGPAIATGGASEAPSLLAQAAKLTQAGAMEAIAKKLGLVSGETLASKIGIGAAKAAIDNMFISGSDEVSKMILKDPNQSAQTAISDIGLSGLIGGGVGALLGGASPLFKAVVGDKLGKAIEDFKGRVNEHIANPDPVSAMTEELSKYYTDTKALADEVYGTAGLKAQNIEKALPLMSEAMGSQASEISGMLDQSIKKMVEKPSAYPPRLVMKLQADLEGFQSAISKDNLQPKDVFNAIQDLKQQVQGYGKFDKFVKPVDEAYDFVRDSKTLARELRTSLEDKAVWGGAAKIQQATNEAFKDYLPKLKDFEKKFTSLKEGEPIIDPTKINTYLNQLGKPNATLKQSMLQDFLDSSERYKQVINKIHDNLGIESPITNSPLNVTMSSLGKKTLGSKLADAFISRGLGQGGASAAGGAVGAGVGSLVGHGGIGALIGQHALAPFFNSVLPAIAKALVGTRGSAEAAMSAINFGGAVVAGDKLLTKAMRNVFSVGTEAVLADSKMPSDKEKDNLNKRLAKIQANPESQFNETSNLGHYLPEHDIALNQAKATAINYLNGLRTPAGKQAPLDSKPVASNASKSVLNNALAIAQQPLVILDKIKKGTLTSGDMAHLNNMYPALYRSMSQRMTDIMTEHLAKGGSIPYRTRQGMSLFLGQPMDSTMTGASILAAQPVSTASQPPSGAAASSPKGVKSSPALQKMPGLYQTPAQARTMRLNKH